MIVVTHKQSLGYRAKSKFTSSRITSKAGAWLHCQDTQLSKCGPAEKLQLTASTHRSSLNRCHLWSSAGQSSSLLLFIPPFTSSSSTSFKLSTYALSLERCSSSPHLASPWLDQDLRLTNRPSFIKHTVLWALQEAAASILLCVQHGVETSKLGFTVTGPRVPIGDVEGGREGGKEEVNVTRVVCSPLGSLGPTGKDGGNNFRCCSRQRSRASCWWVGGGHGGAGVPRREGGRGRLQLLLLYPNLHVTHHYDHLAVFITPAAYLRWVGSPADTLRMCWLMLNKPDHLWGEKLRWQVHFQGVEVWKNKWQKKKIENVFFFFFWIGG